MPDRASTIAQWASLPGTRPIPALTPVSLPQPTDAAYTWTFPGTADQVRVARQVLTTALARCPAADEIVLCLSELLTNAIRHSASGKSGCTVRVRAEIAVGVSVYIEVADGGGLWQPSSSNDSHLHGLGIVRSLAISLSISGNETDGRTVAALFGWHPKPASPSAT